MTCLGEVNGSFILSPYFLIFDPELSPGNKDFIPALDSVCNHVDALKSGEVPVLHRHERHHGLLHDRIAQSFCT